MFSATAAAAVHALAVGLMRTISRASAVYPTDGGGSDVAVLRSACLCVRTPVRLRAHAAAERVESAPNVVQRGLPSA